MPVALRPLFRPLLAAAAAVALAACSGGDEAASSPATYAGTLTDSAIQGVNFTASPSGLSGTTDVNGQFLYRAGDTVT
ncbi:MAG: hypothetical protein K0S16_1680, partial [Moraxellaceae bacterium]|nr:hypothetical protein [Moraxellaceae bacterium]